VRLSFSANRSGVVPIWVGGAFLVCSIAAIFAWKTHTEYKELFEEEFLKLENYSRIVEERITGRIRAAEVLLDHLAESVEREGRFMHPDQMKSALSGFPDLRTLFTANTDGFIVTSTRPEIIGVNISDRDYFEAVREAKDKSRAFLSKVVISRVTNINVLIMVRGASVGANWFGVVGVVFDLNYFHNYLKASQPREDGYVISLISREGQIISRTSLQEQFVGMDISKGGFYEIHKKSGQTASRHRGRPLTDGVDRIIFQRTMHHGMTVTVGRSVDNFLTAWIEKTAIYGVSLFALALFLSALIALVSRRHNELVSIKEGLEAAVTERTRAIKESEVILREAIEAISSGFMMFDKDERLVLWNKAYKDLCATPDLIKEGTDFETLVRARVAAGEVVTDGNDEEWIRSRLARFRSSSAPWEVETRAGETHLVEDTITESGGHIIVRTNISAIKQKERQLEELGDKFKDALESIAEGIILFDANEKIIAFNEHFRKAIDPNLAAFLKPGLSLEEWVTYIADKGHYPEQDGDFVAERIKKFRALEPVEFVESSADKGKRWIVATHYRTRDGGTFLVRKDITEYKKVLHELEAANRAKSEFLANMSHELRTPLNAIIGFSHMLGTQTYGGLNQKQTDYIRDIHKSGLHLLALINDILDMSAIEAGKLVLREESVNIASVIEGARNTVLNSHLGETAPIHVSLPGNIPDIIADGMRLEQVLINLLSNAVKFTPKNGSVSVSVECLTGRPITIKVSDTGVGMSREESDRVLMTRFSRINPQLSERGKGSGLGLNISNELVRRHGGTLAIESEKGKGTTITITLPTDRIVQ
jgi:signal transduction histidine kinase